MKDQVEAEGSASVAVFCSFHGLGEKVLIGLAEFFNQHKQLKFHAYRMAADGVMEEFDESLYDAAVILENGDPLPEFLQHLVIPVVRVFDRRDGCRQPLVGIDHDEIGRMAAQHLHGRGFSEFAFVGGIDAPFAKRRYGAFKQYLDEQGGNLHLFGEAFPSRERMELHPGKVSTFRERMMAWLEALPKPIGIYTVDDWKGFETQMLCRKLGIRIPEDVALIGVNDDDLACQISHPNLSSIRLPFEKLGYEAGASVVQLLKTGKVTDKVLRCIGLVTRGSTNTFAVSDSIVAEALRYIQAESHKPIRVEEVLQHMGVSRSLLERRFRSEIGRTPLVEMRRQRVERARELLADTGMAINKIAEMTGFASNIRFTTVFREQVGVTPTEFRAQMRNQTDEGNTLELAPSIG